MNELISPQVLRAFREAKRWDQKTLAQAAGIDASVISRLERGLQLDLRVSVLVALADALNTPVDALLVKKHQHATPTIPELTALAEQLGLLSEAHQRQVAAILRAYLASIPK
jgi:transcriptional regulator with XRE-family HTH domain